MSLPTSPYPFTFGERVGLVLLAEASATSAFAIMGLLFYISYSAVSITRGSSRRWRLDGPAEVYFLNQLSWDLVQAVGGLMNVKWVADASVQSGPFCSAQGAIKQLSDVGSAISTLIISIYTLKTLCFSEAGQIDDKKKLRHSLIVVACLWASLGLLIAIVMAVDGRMHQFYGPAGYWCWIRATYPVQRIVADFAFIWTTALSNVIIYAILFLYFRGYITINECRLQLSYNPEPVNVLGTLHQPYGLLFYPLVYVLTVLPLSIVRYSTFANHPVPFAVTILVDTIYLSSGLFNVLLFSITRPFLLPRDLSISDSTTERTRDITTIESSLRESLDEVASPQSLGSFGFPRCESPDYWPGFDLEGSVQEPKTSSEGNFV